MQFNVLGVLACYSHSEGSAQLVERYEYTPYGQRTVYSHGWELADVTGDGYVDKADLAYLAAG